MKLGALFSGGKDSTYATMKAMQTDEVSCLITLISRNKESYMFHTPNISLASLQAKSIGIPIIEQETDGEKEHELEDLKKAIKKAKTEHKIEGVVTGAIASTYQATRIQRICKELDIWCFNPLWQKDQIELLEEMEKNRFETIVTAVAAEGLNESWLGRRLDKKAIKELQRLKEKHSLNPAFEGGEAETMVLWCPIFKKGIKILGSEKMMHGRNSGVLNINKAELEKRK